MHPQILRIIDANINRICEGLRVLEDIARFINNDPVSSRKFKSIRHAIRSLGNELGSGLESSRDAENDIGAGHDITKVHHDLPSLIRANSKRAEEGLRVIEELAKLPEMAGAVQSSELKKYRYSIYTLSKDLILKIPDKRGHGEEDPSSRKSKR